MIEKPTECIPEGLYCYKTVSIIRGRSVVKYCPYLSAFHSPIVNHTHPDPATHWVPYCAYLEIDGVDSLLLFDHCKECGENMLDEDDWDDWPSDDDEDLDPTHY